MINTAEKVRVRKKKSASKTSDTERIQKLKRLAKLKEKLLQLEEKSIEQSGDKQSTLEKPIEQSGDISQKSKTTGIDEDKEIDLEHLNAELSDLETKLAKELSDGDLSNSLIDDKLVEAEFEKFRVISEKKDKIKLSQTQITEIDAELEKLEAEIDLEQKKAAVIVSIFDQLCEEHEWLKEPQYGFMYSMPDKKKNKKDYKSWRDDWSNVLFDYSRIASKHIIYSKKLLSEKPWSDLKDRTDTIQEISDSLVKKKVAEWLGKKKEKLRVYWKSLAFWADNIVDWAKENAFTEPIFITDIKEADEDFSTLPDEDILKIFKLIAKQGKGEKFKLDDDQITLLIKFN